MIIQSDRATPVAHTGLLNTVVRIMHCAKGLCVRWDKEGVKCSQRSTPELAFCRAASTRRKGHFLQFILPEAKAAPCPGGQA